MLLVNISRLPSIFVYNDKGNPRKTNVELPASNAKKEVSTKILFCAYITYLNFFPQLVNWGTL